MLRRLVPLAAVLGALAFLAAGCGGDDDSSKTTQWAGNLCSAMTTWTDSLGDATSSLQSNGLSQASIQSAVDDAKTATQTFVDDLKNLGAPDTQAGADAQDAVNELAADLDQDVTDARAAIENSSTVAGRDLGGDEHAQHDEQPGDLHVHPAPAARRQGRAGAGVQGRGLLPVARELTTRRAEALSHDGTLGVRHPRQRAAERSRNPSAFRKKFLTVRP